MAADTDGQNTTPEERTRPVNCGGIETWGRGLTPCFSLSLAVLTQSQAPGCRNVRWQPGRPKPQRKPQLSGQRNQERGPCTPTNVEGPFSPSFSHSVPRLWSFAAGGVTLREALPFCSLRPGKGVAAGHGARGSPGGGSPNFA